MSLHDANSGDVYRDPQGRLWQVLGYWSEPTVRMVPLLPDVHTGWEKREPMFGGVSGLMWEGFTKLEPRP